jgi:peptidyl-prolyl cis-trans isomerase SurA
MRERVVFWVMLAGFLLSPLASAAETLDWIVAVVNNDVILNSELEERLDALKKTSPELASLEPKDSEAFRREVLQQMIRERLAEQEVKRLQVSVSDAEVARAIETVKAQNNLTDAQLEYLLSQEGQTMADFRDKVRRDMERSRLIERVVKSKTVITDEQVDQYLAREGIGGEERRRLAVILLPFDGNASPDETEQVKARAEDIRRRALAGEDFAQLAREHSKGPAAREGGDIGFISVRDMAPPLERATRDLPPGGISEVVRTPGGFYILKVIEVEREKGDPSDANTKERVRRLLFEEEVNRKYEAWIRDLERRAFIEVHLDPPSEGSG